MLFLFSLLLLFCSPSYSVYVALFFCFRCFLSSAIPSNLLIYEKKKNNIRTKTKNWTFNRPGVNFFYGQSKCYVYVRCTMDDVQMRERSVYFVRKRSLFVGHWNGQSTNKNQKKNNMWCSIIHFGIHMLLSWAAPNET